MTLSSGVDHLYRPVDDRQCAQTEEIELYKPGIFHIIFIILRNNTSPFFITIERRKIRQSRWRNDYATCVFTHVTRHTFELYRHVPNFLRRAVLIEKLSKRILLVNCLLQGHPNLEGNQFRKLVGQTIGFVLYARDVAHHGFSRHGAKRNDLRNRFTAVKVCYVIDNFVTTFHTEIDIEIRHRYTLGIEKSFEQQIVF